MTAIDAAAAFHPRLLARASELMAHRRIPGVEPEDLVQETYVRLLTRRRPFVFDGDVRKVHRWLRSTLHGIWQNALGRDREPPSLSLDDDTAWLPEDD